VLSLKIYNFFSPVIYGNSQKAVPFLSTKNLFKFLIRPSFERIFWNYDEKKVYSVKPKYSVSTEPNQKPKHANKNILKFLKACYW